MRVLSDSQMPDFGGGAFADELEKSDSFIPTLIFEEEVPDARAMRHGSLSTDEIDRMGAEGSETNSVDDAQLNEPFSCEDPVSPTRLVLDPVHREIAEVLGTKELNLLRKQNTLLQENVRQLKFEVTSKEKDVEDLRKAKE
uniref:Uncharacterized protein n=1 Tax=Cannabis sativa TaxID=3483 RepID=A0A803NJ56_CANSA